MGVDFSNLTCLFFLLVFSTSPSPQPTNPTFRGLISYIKIPVFLLTDSHISDGPLYLTISLGNTGSQKHCQCQSKWPVNSRRLVSSYRWRWGLAIFKNRGGGIGRRDKGMRKSPGALDPLNHHPCGPSITLMISFRIWSVALLVRF